MADNKRIGIARRRRYAYTLSFPISIGGFHVRWPALIGFLILLAMVVSVASCKKASLPGDSSENAILRAELERALTELDGKSKELAEARMELTQLRLGQLGSSAEYLMSPNIQLTEVEHGMFSGAFGALDDFVRTPHLEVPVEILKAGQEFEVSVFLDQERPRLEESGTSITIPRVEVEETMPLSVWLDGSKHFEIINPIQSIVARRSEPTSTKAMFRVRVAAGVTDYSDSRLVANLSYKQRPRGFAMRRWNSEGRVLSEADAEFEKRCGETLSPDLTIQIRSIGNKKFTCVVSTPHLDDGLRNGDAQPWNIPENIGDLVRSSMDRFVAKGRTAQQRRLSLQAAGLNLYRVAPPNLKPVLWRLIDRDVLKTILIVTDEPSFPWELMIPFRESANEKDEPLGVRFTVGRWFVDNDQRLAPPQRIQMVDALVVTASLGTPRADELAAIEAGYVVSKMNGERILPSTAENVDAMLQQRQASLLHVICHGQADNTGAGRQRLRLDSGTDFVSDEIAAIKGFQSFFAAICDKRPLVFLNACEVGRLEPALVGAGGFAREFAALKAGGVIAPLWSVTHEGAHKVAEEFYRRVSDEPGRSMAEILRDIRAKAYRQEGANWDDSFAAYCFYGDPYCRKVTQEVIQISLPVPPLRAPSEP